MFNDSIAQLNFEGLKNYFLGDLTILHIAISYILLFVVYKALGRYIYFAPQEHSSRINRTFLALSLLIVLLHYVRGLSSVLPFLPEHRWIFVLGGLILVIAPLSMISRRIIWKYVPRGYLQERSWHDEYLPIHRDAFKAPVSQSSQSGSITTDWQIEGIATTKNNIHSDALLNLLAFLVFLGTTAYWAHLSAMIYGSGSYFVFSVIVIPVAILFINQALFAWIRFLENKGHY